MKSKKIKRKMKKQNKLKKIGKNENLSKTKVKSKRPLWKGSQINQKIIKSNTKIIRLLTKHAEKSRRNQEIIGRCTVAQAGSAAHPRLGKLPSGMVKWGLGVCEKLETVCAVVFLLLFFFL